jgi:hypothetical protein
MARAVDCLVKELEEERFPTYGVMDSMGLVYPQYLAAN